jgi:hypothetical protein
MKLSVCVAAVAVTGLALGLTACGPAPSAAPAPTTSQRQGFPQRRPGVSGTVAALSDNTMQVQNTQGQTAVTFGAATHFTDTTAASLAGVTTGECVLATGTSGSGGAITATSVSIMDSCANRPGQPRAAATRRQFAAGTVKSLSSKGFTLARTTGGTVTVTVGAHTTYAKTTPATATALAVGECVMASGQADSTGTVTATTVAIRPAGPNGCTTGRRPTGGVTNG